MSISTALSGLGGPVFLSSINALADRIANNGYSGKQATKEVKSAYRRAKQ